VTINPFPDCYIPSFASLYGVSCGSLSYLTTLHPNDRLPRGCKKKVDALRKRIINSINSRTQRWAPLGEDLL